MISNLPRRVALAAATVAASIAALAGCVTTLKGSAGYSPASSATTGSGAASTSAADPKSEMKKQCEAALTTAKGFLDSWKNLASSGITPTAEQRNALAAEVQGYIDQLNAQLPTIVDTTLVSHVQAIVAEMSTIVSGLTAGIAVELTGYRAAVNATTDYCK